MSVRIHFDSQHQVGFAGKQEETCILGKRAQAQVSHGFRGHGNVQGIHECACASESDSEGVYSVSTVFSLVHFSPDQSLPPQMGLKSTTLLNPPHIENWLQSRAQPHTLLLLPRPSLPGSPRERE